MKHVERTTFYYFLERTSMSLKFRIVALFCATSLMFPMLPVVAQPTVDPNSPNSPADATGEEYLRKMGLTTIDPVTGQSYTIFEAITNRVDTTSGVLSKKGGRWYISPLCVFQLPAKLPTPSVSDTEAIYSIKMSAFNPSLLQDAASKINGQLSNFQIPLNQVQSYVGLMPIQKVSFNIADDLKVTIADIGKGTTGQKVSLSQDVVIEVRVPISNRAAFEQRVTSTNGLPCSVSVVYNAINLKKQLIKYSGIDIQNTDTFHKLNQEGAAVVNSSQVQDMLMDISRSKNWEQFEDPNMRNKLSDKAFDMFIKMINTTDEQKSIDSASASNMDEKIRKGTGLSAEEFKPITLMRQVVSKIQDTSNFEEANKVMNSEYEANKEKWDVSGSAGWGPFSASVGYSKENQTSKSKFFSNDTELKQFKDKYIETSGPDAVFKMRGIHLLETGKFTAKLASLVDMISFEPSVEQGTIVITSQMQMNSALKADQYQFMPVGSVIAFGGKRELLPSNWAVCEGQEVAVSEFPVLYQKLKDFWGTAAAGQFKLPDLRGYFLRGIDGGSGRDPENASRVASGANSSSDVGSIQSDSTALPHSSRFVTDDENAHTHQDPTYNGVPGNYELASSSSGTWHEDYGPQAAPTGPGSPHHHSVISGGDSETRPKNAYVYWIIKLH